MPEQMSQTELIEGTLATGKVHTLPYAASNFAIPNPPGIESWIRGMKQNWPGLVIEIMGTRRVLVDAGLMPGQELLGCRVSEGGGPEDFDKIILKIGREP